MAPPVDAAALTVDTSSVAVVTSSVTVVTPPVHAPATPVPAVVAAAAEVQPEPAAEVAPLVADTPKPAEVPMSRRARRVATAAQPAVLPDPVIAPVEPFELLEPESTDAGEAPADEEAPAEASASSADEPDPVTNTVADAFEAAARLFSFTGETATLRDAEPGTTDDGAAHAVPRGGRAGRGESVKRATAVSFSVGVMGIVGLMTVGMTTPAVAVAAAGSAENPVAVLAVQTGDAEEVPESEIQAYVAPAETENASIERSENYSTTTMAELAYESGIQNISNFFVNDPNSSIQWPFAVGVPISYGFGMRSGQMHEGVDFTPGSGSPIQAIADGVVRVASEAGGAYGVHVIIDHEIDGQLVSSHYAHLQYGSIQVQPGQQVTVGTILGRTGNTGRSYGAHTHFEILLGGTTAIDPIPWLRQHAGG